MAKVRFKVEGISWDQGGTRILESAEELSKRSGEDLESLVDEELEAFQAFMLAKVDAGRLIPVEKTIIKTYLWWKTHPNADPA